MRKNCVKLIALSLLFVLTGCSQQADVYTTLATPFSETQREEMGLSEVCNDFYAENLQAYQTAAGGTELYLYSAPIEISQNSLMDSQNSFIAEGDYFKKEFPKVLSEEQPIAIGASGNFANLYVEGQSLSGELADCKNTFGIAYNAVRYQDAFGKGMDYICYPTSFGVNTEIVLPRRSKNNTFQIKLQLPNLAPDTSSPDYILFKTALEKGDVRSILYTPMAVDKNGRWSYANTVRLTEKDSENNIYTVEYAIDQEFLDDKQTKYPVVINQAVHLYKSKQPDTSAYETTGDVASHYLSPYVLLGDSTLKGEGWTYVRYETLNRLDIDADQVLSAEYCFHVMLGAKKETNVSAYAVTADWCSINTRWFNRPPFDEKPISEVIVKDSGDYRLDITALFKEMIKNKGKENAKYSVQNSFMIRSDTEDSNLLIASGDSGLFSPYIKIVLAGA